MLRLALLTVCCALGACLPRIDTGPDGGARGPIHAGPEGGLFIRECGALNIPAGALAGEAEIQMTPVTAGIPPLAGRTLIGTGCRIGPATLVFQKDVTVTLPYQEELLPAAGLSPADFRVYGQLGAEPPTALDAPQADTTLKVVSGSTRQLGLFWVVSPNDPTVGDFTVEPPEVVLGVGGTAQLTARITGLSGEPLEDVPVQWRVVPARVGTVDAQGLFTARAPGNATVVAKASTLTREVRVAVAGTTPGPVTFVHDTPFPTGNDLLGGALGADGALLAAGTNGTVLGRTPGPGGTWSRLFSSPLVRMQAVARADTRAVAVGTLGTTGVLVAMAAGAQAPTVQRFPTSQPRALWYDGTHGMAVGSGSDVLVLRGEGWTTEYSPSFETLLSVVGDGQGGFVTVGSQGSLYVYDAATRTWDALYRTQLSVLLTAAVVADAAGSEAWAVGGNQLWHFVWDAAQKDGAWTALNLPATPAVERLTAVGLVDGKVVVGGAHAGAGTLLTYEPAGGTWTPQPLRGPQVVRALVGQGTQGYALGDFGAVWRKEATGWVEESRGFYGDVADVSVAPDGTVVAAVNDCRDAGCTESSAHVVRRAGAGGDWVELLPEADGAGRKVLAVLARSATDVLLGTSTGVLHFDGTRWAPAGSTAGPASINALTLCDGQVWAVGSRGTVLAGTGTLSPMAPSTTRDLFAVHCTDALNVWTAGNGVLLENGAPRETKGVNQAPWFAVYTPADGEAYTFGEAGYGLFWDTERLRVLESPGGLRPRALLDMWGSSIDNLYAVGLITEPLASGVALRFDGAGWSLVDAGASRTVTAVTGTGNAEVWLGTHGGGVLRGVPP